MLLIFSSCLIVAPKAYAQQEFPIKTYLSHSYYEEDGLASNMVYKMAQSADGLMWFVTHRGISTFDGIRWQSHDVGALYGLTSRSLLTPLQGGDMLLSSLSARNTQLIHFHNQQSIPLSLPHDFHISEETRMLHTQAGVTEHLPGHYLIALVNEGHLYLYNSENKLWDSFKMPDEISWKKMGSIHFFENNIMLLAESGLASFDITKKKFDLEPIPEIAGRPIIDAATSVKRKGLYFLGDNYIGYYHRGKYDPILEDLYLTPPAYLGFHNILIDRHDRIFFHHHSSIFKYNLQTTDLEHFKLDEVSEDIPTGMFEDLEGNIWFSTLRGLKKVNSFLFHSFGRPINPVSTEISAVVPIDSSSVLLGSNHGFLILTKNELLSFPLPLNSYSVVKNNRILGAATSSTGEVSLAANSLGIGTLRADHSIEWFPPPAGESITALTYHQGKLFASSNNGLLYQFHEGQYTLVWQEKNLYIRKLISRNDELFILSNFGLFVLSDTGTSNLKGETLQDQSLYSYLEWNGRQFLGSVSGLCEIKGGKISKVAEDSLQPNRPVYAMLTGPKGRLWLGTDKGIFVSDQGRLINYESENGLKGKEINRSAFELMADGSIWVGTDKGLSVYNPEDEHIQNIVPRLRITQVVAQGSEVKEVKNQPLSYQQNNLEFIFQAIGFYQPEENNFRYRLEGLDKDWVYSDNHLINQVRYTNLPEGSYRFEIQVRNGNGPWSQAAQSNLITIRPPFYKTWWFILSILLIISSLGYMTHALITNKENEKMLRKAIQMKKAEVAESEKRFRAVWASTDTCFVLINRQGKIQMANPSFCRLLRKSPEQVCGNFLRNLLPEAGFEETNLKQIYKQRKIHRSQVVANLHQETYYLLATITFVEQPQQDEELMSISFKDFTVQKKAETSNIQLNEELTRHNMALLKKEDELANYNHELVQNREELEQALRAVEERNYQLDQFVYKTSHDLRAPIASALGLINIIKMDSNYERWPEYLELIKGALQKQDLFIKAMLNFSKSTRSKNKAESIDFNDLILQCLQELQGLPGYEEVTQQLQPASQGVAFYSDKMKLQIILANLISNAIKYRDPLKESYMNIQIRLSTIAAEIVISDNGIGIPVKYQNQIFDMFFRATERSEGSGLGLYLVKQTVAKLEGEIIIESEQGKGTTFKVYIPNQQASPGSDKLPNHEDSALNRSTIS